MAGEIPTTVVGLMGLVITVLAGVVVQLYRTNSRLYAQIYDLQNQRVTDAKETRDKLAVPMQEMAQYTKLTYNKIIGGE